MEIQTSQWSPEITQVALAGRLTMGQPSQEVEAAFLEWLGAGARMFVVDMTEVPTLDSAGLGTLILCASKAKESGGWLRLANVSPRLTQILHLTGTDQVIGIFASVSEAASF